MKHFFTIVHLIMCLSIFSQETTLKTDRVYDEFKVHSIKYTVNSAEDLKSINWNDVKEIFKENNTEELIELAFEINLPNSKNKYKSSVKAGGKSEDIDALIKIMKKGVKVITKIISEK